MAGKADRVGCEHAAGLLPAVNGRLRSALKRTPVLGPGLVAARQRLSHLKFPGSARYWEERYAGGEGSGAGSLGRLREFKAGVVNTFLEEEGVQSVIEFGCGDGGQLQLAQYPAYIGLDVSPTAVRLCMRLFSTDRTKSFFLYDPTCFRDHQGVFRADVSLSLDVVYHLVEDDSFETHMRHLFAAEGSWSCTPPTGTGPRRSWNGVVRHTSGIVVLGL